MAVGDSIEVEIVYALPHLQRVIPVRVPARCSVEAAIRQSGILAEFPAIDLARVKVGVHGRRVELGAEIRAGDRVEIYRPLTADPKAVRREHAARAAARVAAKGPGSGRAT